MLYKCVVFKKKKTKGPQVYVETLANENNTNSLVTKCYHRKKYLSMTLM